MKSSAFLLCCLSILLVGDLVVRQAVADCNVCGQNGIACIDETDFYLCSGGKPIQTQQYSCPAGTVCTHLGVKCAAGIDPDCSEVLCGCDGTKMFSCLSRTTFAQCNGTKILQKGACPIGLLCDSSEPGICVDECKLEGKVLECDKPAP